MAAGLVQKYIPQKADLGYTVSRLGPVFPALSQLN
jgi:hypothetical protein